MGSAIIALSGDWFGVRGRDDIDRGEESGKERGKRGYYNGETGDGEIRIDEREE